MGFIANRTHDDKLLESGWISLNDKRPKDYTNVYLRCNYMMDDFVTIGQIAGDSRISSDCDPDIFFRSAILSWKPLD